MNRTQESGPHFAWESKASGTRKNSLGLKSIVVAVNLRVVYVVRPPNTLKHSMPKMRVPILKLSVWQTPTRFRSLRHSLNIKVGKFLIPKSDLSAFWDTSLQELRVRVKSDEIATQLRPDESVPHY